MKIKIKQAQADRKVVAVAVGDAVYFPRIKNRIGADGVPYPCSSGHYRLQHGVVKAMLSTSPSQQLDAIAGWQDAVVIYEGDALKVKF